MKWKGCSDGEQRKRRQPDVESGNDIPSERPTNKIRIVEDAEATGETAAA
jgi:hypothetical protein